MTDARTVAWRIVRTVHRDGAWTGPAVDRALSASRLDARDRAFASNLAFQTLRWEGTLDWALGHVVRRGLRSVDDDVLDLLRCGAWQLLFGRMPDRAAVSATVDVARAQLGARVVGFVNGVLRNLARRRSTLPWPPDDSAAGRALRLGYPRWVVDEADARFGPSADGELDAGNQPPELTVRTTGAADAADVLTAAGAAVRPGRLAPDAVHVDGIAPAEVLRHAPRAVIQDEASMVVGRVAAAAFARGRGNGADPGADRLRVLDVCAAPGGKSTHLAALGCTVVAADRSVDRLALVGDLGRRLDLPLALVAADGARPPWRAGAFDGVLLDAPCSGLGVVRRRPELRWRRDAGDIASLAALQARLLAASATAVGDGGALVYSVCTWTRAETTAVIDAFLRDHPAYVGEAVTVPGIAAQPADAVGGRGLQLMSSVHGCDGMYIAVLRRREVAPTPPGRR
jgi:16S rRNA (cytosine967-C5)-methyltransferase